MRGAERSGRCMCQAEICGGGGGERRVDGDPATMD